MNNNVTPPIIMTIAGHDPTGGAGIQADIEAILSMGGHPVSVVTALTVQDTQRVSRFVPTDASLLIEQCRAVLEDMPIAAIKIGMIGSISNVEAIHSILRDYPQIPVVLDPVLRGGGGGNLAHEEMEDALVSMLLPLTTILTPNSIEARALAPEADTLDACAQELLDSGCKHVLITGSHENTRAVENRLYAERRLIDTFSWDRLPGEYHGSGCTLASAIAALLGQGLEPFTAIHEAQDYTWQTLKHGQRLGMGQLIPNRLFWARDDEGHDDTH